MKNQSLKSHHSQLTTHNSKGISVISVIITVIVIILIASITIFGGYNIYKQSKEDSAYEKLDVVYQAIKANEEVLGIGDTIDGEKTLSKSDYVSMGLEYYTKDKDFDTNTITITKRIGGIEDTTNTEKRTYHLTYNIGDDETYDKEYEFAITSISYSTEVSFDKTNGVNMPMLTEDMQAINYANSSDGEEYDNVNDIYTERWYSYDNSSPNYANMIYNDNKYVWIPRFAYKIQTYYKNNMLPNIPNSAIDIIFLNGTSNLDINGNKLPDDYIVHPAFKDGANDIAGFWVEKNHHSTAENISNVSLSSNAHLLTNSEWSAIAYLAQTMGAAKSDSSTNNYSGVMDINSDEIEFVSACVNYGSASSSLGSHKDVYTVPTGEQTLKTANASKVGDALVETSTTDSETSAWYNSETIVPTSAKPYIARGVGSSVFSYTCTNGNESPAYYREVLYINN